jgi:hypothetical protein
VYSVAYDDVLDTPATTMTWRESERWVSFDGW